MRRPGGTGGGTETKARCKPQAPGAGDGPGDPGRGLRRPALRGEEMKCNESAQASRQTMTIGGLSYVPARTCAFKKHT